MKILLKDGRKMTARYVKSHGKRYAVTRGGNVLSMPNRTRGGVRELKQRVNSYVYVTLHDSRGEQYPHTVHRLVAEAYIPNPRNKPCVNHKNGIKTDNRVDNLEWCTRSENQKHAHDTGLIKPMCGEKTPLSKLKNKEVLQIREMYGRGTTQKEIGNIFKIHQTTVSYIVNRVTWYHI